jgi:hypothetical protein
MPFTSKQRRSLAAKLKHQHVKTRSSQGAMISYLEGWHVIASRKAQAGVSCSPSNCAKRSKAGPRRRN